MPLQIAPVPVHPLGEVARSVLPSVPLAVDTVGSRFHVEWDPDAPVTPLGQLVFFSQFLATAGLFRDWVADCPLRFTSPNAPLLPDLLGTILLSVLSGHWRYAHVTALRGDRVNPVGLGMTQVCCEDSVRRAFQEQDAVALARWQDTHLRQSVGPALDHPWILDLDVTVKPVYGHQEGAELGYNPTKPGRPSHAYHTGFIAGLRLALEVEVRPGKQHAAGHGFARLWQLLDGLPAARRPWLVRGDSQYGQEILLRECEARQLFYLFRLRQTKKVKQLIAWLERQGRWQPAGQGWTALEGTLQLQGWSQARRVVVLRRPRARAETTPATQRLLPWTEAVVANDPHYEYLVLVTNLTWSLLELAEGYRQRADCENNYDQLKNQWGWGGFTTKDLLRCQVAARNVALIYNWWSLFTRLAEPTRPREALTSRPLLLSAVGRLVRHSGQTILRLTSQHAAAAQAQELLTGLSLFLSGLQNTAEQLTSAECWRRIYARILAPYLQLQAVLPGPSG